MTYKNESEVLTKCYKCGCFINANNAWYEQQPDGYVEPICNKCHNKTKTNAAI